MIIMTGHHNHDRAVVCLPIENNVDIYYYFVTLTLILNTRHVAYL